MKPKTFRTTALLTAAFTAVTLGSVAILTATPEMAPEGDIGTAEFVQMEIYHDAHMRGAEVEVGMENGIATLTGTAESLAQVERATRKLFSKPEVLTVVNRLEITPGDASGIVAQAKGLLKNQEMLDASGIGVSSDGSRLILEGTVSTMDEGELAREIVTAANGVTAVDNRLVIDFRKPRTDAQIAKQLDFIVQDDPVYAGLHLLPEVSGGVVSWEGEVGSRGEFDRLIRQSYVTGVIEVEASGLTVNGDLMMEASEDKNYSPSQCMEAFHAAMEHDPRMDASDILAEIHGGVIILKGTAETQEISDAAERTARGIPGVLGVDNRLTVGKDTRIASSDSPPDSASVAPQLPRR